MEKFMAAEAKALAEASIDWSLIEKRVEDIHHRIRRAAKHGERSVPLPAWITYPQYEPVCNWLSEEGYDLVKSQSDPYIRW